MTKELTLQVKDLQVAGIKSDLTSGDLLEVVAHDIFDKFMAEINDCIKAGSALRTKSNNILQPEFDAMKTELVKSKMMSAKEADSANTGYSKVNGDEWAAYTYCSGIKLTDKDRGTLVGIDTTFFSINFPKGSQCKVKMKMTCDEKEEDQNSKAKDITCKIVTTTRKEFERVITIATDRFKSLIKEISEHNKRVNVLEAMLPANNILSVERFTREARVKMNKKILASQPDDFKKKIPQLFNIQL